MELLVFNLGEDSVFSSLAERDMNRAWRNLLPFGEYEAVSGDIGREYIIRLLAEDVNIFSEVCAKNGTCGDALFQMAVKDMEQVWQVLSHASMPYKGTAEHGFLFAEYGESLLSLMECKTPQELTEGLKEHYSRFGCGPESKYIAFRYAGNLVGITGRDQIHLDHLIGLERQKETLVENTKAFLEGKPANNALLFGDSGCGKSSSVKALLNLFYKDGLRLIEFSKEYMKDLPALFGRLKQSRLKYIVFLDDLTFEDDDPGYKHLKIAMDGQLEPKPDNVLLYATSNRRHLVKEYWSDREHGEVNTNDTMQEKLSLSERFGIHLVFASPSQVEYLNIVKGLLSDAGAAFTQEAEQAALRWAMRFNGRSGRTAKQFVSSYLAALQ